jgi:uncharacterized protein
MKENDDYRQDVAFINRKKELDFLNQFVAKKPNEILFLYGPKSSGKTTLLYKFIEEIKSEKVEIKFLNLRQVLIDTYKDFINVFFTVEKTFSKAKKYLANASAGIFHIDEELAKRLILVQADPFIVMRNQLQEMSKKGIKTILIIDELQALHNIYINKEREVIKELFNFFVSMTKELHIAHIIVSSSDGYFIDQIYNESKLKKTSDFYEIDYLEKEDVWEWLSNLEKYSQIKNYTLTDEEIQYVWDTLGGSCWEIQLLLSKFFNDPVKKVCDDYKIKMKNLIVDYVVDDKYEPKTKILKNFVEHTILPKDKLIGADFSLLADMVHNNILYYNPVTSAFAPQGRSVDLGIKLYFK